MASSTIVGLNAVLQPDSRKTILQSWGNKTVQNATEQRNIIAASLRKGKMWIIRSVTKPTRPFTAIGPTWRIQRSQKWFDLRAWRNRKHPNAFGNEAWFWLKIQSMWKWFLISGSKLSYSNAIVHILCSKPSMCSAQVHMVTRRRENIRHHVVHMEKWEHLQF